MDGIQSDVSDSEVSTSATPPKANCLAMSLSRSLRNYHRPAKYVHAVVKCPISTTRETEEQPITHAMTKPPTISMDPLTSPAKLADGQRTSSLKLRRAKMPPASRSLKRKRSDPVTYAIESKQVFKSFSFFFIPNNDIAPVRAHRIRKAVEHGASWTKKWGGAERITHVVVDREIHWIDVMKYLKLGEGEQAGKIFINDLWLSDCITHGVLLSHSLSSYIIKDMPVVIPCEKRARDHQSHACDEDADRALKSTKLNNKFETSSRSGRSPQCLAASHEVLTQNPAGDPILDAEEALQAEISKAKAAESMCYESEGEDETPPSSEGKTPTIKSVIDCRSKSPEWIKHFRCGGAPAPTSTGPNAKITEVLQKMLSYYEGCGDQWRSLGYRKALTAVKKQKEPITSKEQAFRLKGIGERIAEKIEEIAQTDGLRQLDARTHDSLDKAQALFQGIYGVGYGQARKWAEAGYRTLEHIRTYAVTELTNNQKIGLEHYYDFNQRIPRDEVTLHGEVVRKAVHDLDQKITVIVGGSYRRGKADCGDIDVLMSRKGKPLSYLQTLIFENVVPTLQDQGYLTASLAVPSQDTGTKWHGACQLPQEVTVDISSSEDTEKDHGAAISSAHRPWRRIDLLVVPENEFGAALLYFTGNDILNRSMRLLARRMCMRLNQHGLFLDDPRRPYKRSYSRTQQVVERDAKAHFSNNGGPTINVRVAGETEESIFEALGLRWRPPEEREC